MPNQRVRVVARIIAKQGKVEELGVVLRGLVTPTRKEPGCVSYELMQNHQDPTDFTFIEEWRSDADIDAHMEAPHVRQARSALPDLVAVAPDIRRYRVLG